MPRPSVYRRRFTSAELVLCGIVVALGIGVALHWATAKPPEQVPRHTSGRTSAMPGGGRRPLTPPPLPPGSTSTLPVSPQLAPVSDEYDVPPPTPGRRRGAGGGGRRQDPNWFDKVTGGESVAPASTPPAK